MRDQFLALIRAAPEDDFVRLVYADYLDETGDAARAELIRTQVALARLHPNAPEVPAIEDRVHALLSEHEARWLTAAFGTAHRTGEIRDWEFRRGMLEQVVARSIAGLPESLTEREPVFDLNLDEPNGPEFLDGRFADVRRLGVAKLLMPDEADGFLRHFPNLTALSLVVHYDSSPAAGLRVLRHLPNADRLRSIDLFFAPFAENEFDEFLSLIGSARLTKLSCGPTFEVSQLRRLLASPAAATLTSLSEVGEDLQWMAGVLNHACPAARLRELAIIDESSTWPGLFELLDSSPVRDSLTTLTVPHLGSEEFNRLKQSDFWQRAKSVRMHPEPTFDLSLFHSHPPHQWPPSPDLELLDLSGYGLSSDNVIHMTSTDWAPNLRWLGLSRNELDDRAVQALANSGVFPHLHTLHLASSSRNPIRITDDGVLALARSASLKRLRFLTLDECRAANNSLRRLLDNPHWNLAGLGLSRVNLSRHTVAAFLANPKFARLEYLDLSHNRRLGGDTLLGLAESEYLSPLLELDLVGVPVSERVAAILAERLGPRLSL